MKKIGHIRIDDRLIHGQIVAAWIQALGCTTIVVADDMAAQDSLQRMLLEMAVPPGLKCEIFSIAEAAAYFTGDVVDNAKVLLVLRNAEAALALIEAGVNIPALTVGNVSAGPNRTKYSKSVFLSESDIACFKTLDRKEVRMEVRVVPGEKAVDLLTMLS